MVEEHKFFSAAFHNDVDCFAPVAVSPATLPGSVLLGKVLSVVNQNVCTFSQLANVLIEDRMTRLIIRSVNDDFVVRFNTEPQASLRMVQPHGLNHAIIKSNTV